MSLEYKPDGPVLRDFMKDDHFFRGIRGPVGSGKSAGCAVELMRRALAQQPGPDGRRKSRWAIVRNTNPQLRTTTIKTWLDWFPEHVWGKMAWHPPPYTHHIKKGALDAEFIFLALDRPEDVKKLLSLELTGVWINEAREVPKPIIDACTMRVSRYPSMKDGGPTWYGVIADSNAPDDDHWWPIMAGDAPLPDHVSAEEALMLVKPPTWQFFTQPAAMVEERDEHGDVSGYKMNPKAENASHLAPGYYKDIIAGKTRSWIDVYVMNRLGSIADGKPVYPQWSEDVHLAKEDLQPVPGVPIIVGLDFGLTPAATFLQQIRGRWLVLGELVAFDMGAVRFSEVLRRECAARFPGWPPEKFVFWGDPSGDYRAQSDETTPFQMFRRAGITVRKAPTNDPVLRIEAVVAPLTRLVDGAPGLLVDPGCTYLKKGFAGGYAYRRLAIAGAERFTESPDKNKFSHVHDALQYALCGGGESRALLSTADLKPVQVPHSFDVFARGREKRRRFGSF